MAATVGSSLVAAPALHEAHEGAAVVGRRVIGEGHRQAGGHLTLDERAVLALAACRLTRAPSPAPATTRAASPR